MRAKERLHRIVRALSLAFALAIVGACAAPAPDGGVQADADKEAATRTAAVSPAAPVAETQPPAPKKPMNTGGPLPPERIDESRPAPAPVDTTCSTDADCTVKNVGNCCGYYPACVNVDSPTDPKGVQAECARKGMASVCGFQDISSCSCKQGHCEAESNGTVQ